MVTLSWPDLDRTRLLWWLVAIALGAMLAFVVGAFLGAFVLGLFLYYSTRPIHYRLRGHVGPPSVTAAIALIALGLPIVLLVAYTVLVGLRELGTLVSENEGTVAELLEPYVDVSQTLQDPMQAITVLLENPDRLTQFQGADIVGSLFGSVAGASAIFLGAAIQLFIALAFAFYLLRDDRRLATWFQREFSGGETAADRFFEAVDRDLRTVYFGNILNAFAIAVIATVAYNGLNVFAPPGLAIPSPTLIGLLTGAGSLVPVVGMKIVYVPVALILAAEAVLSDPALLWMAVAFFLISLVIVDTIPDFLLRPYVSGRNLHTGTVMFAYILGPMLFGWYGLFLGPLLLVLLVHFVRIVLPGLVRGEALVPEERDRARPTDPPAAASVAAVDDPLDDPRPSDRSSPEGADSDAETGSGREAGSESGSSSDAGN